MNFNLILNQKYSKEEIEKIFETNFGMGIKGITQRKWKNEFPYIILFSKEDGPYSDRTEEQFFFYDGEGTNKDQELTVANKALINSNKDNRPIFGFVKNILEKKWEYIGILKVIDYTYIPKRGFNTFEFKLLKTQLESLEEPDEIKKELEISLNNEPTLLEESKLVKSYRKIRNAYFSKRIKEIYECKCSICGKRRFSNTFYPEVESAHIYPREKNGSNDLRNGISLCKLHHWAFDNGLLSITDNLSIIVKKNIKTDNNYSEIYLYENKKILTPNEIKLYPHKIFLSEHRKIHRF